MKTAPQDYYRSFYDERSDYWDTLYKTDTEGLSIFAVHFRQRREVILRMVRNLPRPEGAKYLDAGCGPGAYIAPLLDLGYHVSAFDQSQGMVDKAARNFDPAHADRVDLKVAGVDDIPFPDGQFDLVTNVAVLMYLPDERRVIRELARVLKPGGTLIITVDNRKDLADTIDLPMRLRRLLGRLGPRKAAAPEGGAGDGADGAGAGGTAVQPRTYSPREIRDRLTEAGLVIDEETSVGFAPFYLNGRRVAGDRTDLRLDRALGFLRRIPGLRLTGYTYLCRCHRPAA